MSGWRFRPHGIIVDEETFGGVTELEIRQAVRLRYAVSMLTIHQSNSHVANPAEAAEQLAEVVSPLIRNTDLIEIGPSAATVRVLLVGGELEDLRNIAQRIITEISPHRFDERHTPVVLSIGGSCFPATAGSSRELFLQADALAAEAHQTLDAYSTYRFPDR
jgi:hypothetical protein